MSILSIIVSDLNETTLRNAVATANGSGGTTTISFAAGLSGGTVFLNTALELQADIVIDGDTNGDGKADITISGQDKDRVFVVDIAGADVTLKSLNIVDGKGVGLFGSGGAIVTYAGTTLNIANSTLSGNHSDQAGGAIAGFGRVELVNSTLFGNDASVEGGAIFVGNAVTLGMVNTTITGNDGGGFGGGISTDVDGEVYAINGTITGNHASDNGGGIAMRSDASLSIRNTIVAGNSTTSGTNPNIVRFGLADATISADNCIVGSDVSVTFTAGGNIVANSGIVGALADNGGVVKTMAPSALAQDKGIDAGNDYLDADHDGDVVEELPLDARGSIRKYGPAQDIGAHERIGAISTGVAITEDASPNTADNLALHASIGSAKVTTGKFDGAGGSTVAIADAGTNLTGKYGTLKLFSDGYYIYTLNNDDADTNALAAGASVTEQFTATVSATSGSNTFTDTSTISIAITGANDAPNISTIVSGFSQAENTTATLATIAASDVDSSSLTYSVIGADGALFQISNAGVLAFKAAPDFEHPHDANGENAYQITVQVSDGTAVCLQSYTVTVTDLEGNRIRGSNRPDTIDDTHGIRGKVATGEQDTISGLGGSDTIRAGDGNDLVKGGIGRDNLDGDKGVDTVDYSDKTVSVSLDLSITARHLVSVKVGGVLEDSIREFENVIGGRSDDSLSGDKRANMLVGNDGDDFLFGNNGDDILVGGLGLDSLKGGGGGDKFVFIAALGSDNADHIVDFTPGVDKILLDHTIFAALGPTIEAEEFRSTGKPTTRPKDADDHLLYNSKSGKLYYDADGVNGTPPILVATLDNLPHLGIADFVIV